MTITAVSLDALAPNRPAARAPAEGPMALGGASFAAMLHAQGPQRPAPRGTAAAACRRERGRTTRRRPGRTRWRAGVAAGRRRARWPGVTRAQRQSDRATG